MSHIKINNQIFLCKRLFMSTPITTTSIKPKKRLLNASKRTAHEKPKVTPQEPKPTPEEPKKRKKRILNRPISSLSTLNGKPAIVDSSQPISSPQPATPAPTKKRSIRSSSEAIAQREKNRMASTSRSPTPIEEEKPVTKKKRKLNSQKTIMSANALTQDIVFEETGNFSYSEYLESSSSLIPRQNKPNIVIGVPSKQNRIKTEPISQAPVEQKPPQSTVKIQDTLDLSHHSILPNSSYIAHLPDSHSRRAMANDSDTSSQNSKEDEHMEEVNHVQDTHMDTNQVEQEQVNDTRMDTQQTDDMEVENDNKEVLFNMMDSDNYVSDSSLGEFYDANSDFDEKLDNTQPKNMEILAEVNSSKKVNTFWNSLFKSFK